MGNTLDTAIFLRRGRPRDAAPILEVHRSAVLGSATAYYSQEVLNEWAPINVAPAQVATFEHWINEGKELIVVAVDRIDVIVGFGSIVPEKSELRAVYVAPEYERRGVGRAILRRLEDIAREAGACELRMEASLNAVAFYEAHGFIVLERGEHTLSSGLCMSCVHMRKPIR